MRKLAIVLLWILASAAIVGAQTNINNGGGGGGVTSVTGTAPVQSSGGATPAISLTTPFQQSIAPNQNAIYASPNCGTQTNCVTVHDDTQVVTDATFTSSSKTVTCPNSDCNFVAGDVGKVEFGIVPAGSGYSHGLLSVPQGTITAVNNANSVTVSAAATGSSTGGGTFVWGSDDTTDLAAVWTAALAGPCSVSLPWGNAQGTGPAIMLTSTGQFNTISAHCQQLQANSADFTSVIAGGGPGVTTIGLEPSFSFATSSCPSHICFIGWTNAQGELRDLSISGFGNDLSVGSACPSTISYGLNLPNYFNIYDIYLIGFGSSCANLEGVRTAGSNQILSDVIDDSFGGGAGFECATGSGQPCIYRHSSSQNQLSSTGASLLVDGSGSVANVENSMFGPTLASGYPVVFVMSGGTLYSSKDFLTASAIGTSDALQCRGVCHLDQDNWTSTTASSSGVRIFDGGVVYMRDTTVGGGSYGLECDSNTGGVNTFVDLGGNTFSGSQSINAQCILTGSANSANSVGVTAAKLVLSSGWGSTAAWTSLSGGDFPIQGTITNSGTGQGASPTITYTFPTPLLVAPYSCTAVDPSGTNTLGTFTASSLTTTGVVFTFSLTPTVSDTELVQITCVTP